MDHYKWHDNINTTDSKSLKNIISDVLHSKQYNQYIMDINCDQQGKLTKERAHRADLDPKIFDTELKQEPLTEIEIWTVSDSIQLTTSSNYLGQAESIPLPAVCLSSRDYKAKFQYWLVYEDVGKPLDKIPNLKLFSKGIHNACIGIFHGYSMDD